MRNVTVFMMFFVFLFALEAFSAELQVKRIICGSPDISVSRVFSDWNNIQFQENSGVLVERFNEYVGSWDVIDLKPGDFMSGFYRLNFSFGNCLEIRGSMPADMGGVSFNSTTMSAIETLFQGKREDRYLSKLKRFLGKVEHQVYLSTSTDGLDLTDQWIAQSFNSSVLVIPLDAQGTVDLERVSRGDKGISLHGDFPFIIIEILR